MYMYSNEMVCILTTDRSVESCMEHDRHGTQGLLRVQLKNTCRYRMIYSIESNVIALRIRVICDEKSIIVDKGAS